MALLELLIILLLSLASTSHGRRVDLTLQRDAMGADVVRAVQSKLDDTNLFNASPTLSERQVYELFIRESAYVESLDGSLDSEGGIWRVSRNIFQQTQQYNLEELFDGICRFFCIDWLDVQYDQLRNPLYSGLALNIYLHHLYNINQRLQDTATDVDRAIFWVTSFGESRFAAQWLSRVEQLRRVEVCRVNTDVVFVVDSSGSIGADNYQLVRDYVYNFTEGLLNGDTNSRVGIILYSDIADIEIELETRRPALLEEIRNLTYIARFTNTPEGLCLLKSRPWRASVSVLRIAIVLTDGQSNRVSATCMQEGGEPGTLNSTTEEVHTFQPPITVFAVGVANFVEQELLTIASSPDLVDRLDSFDYRLLVQNQQSRSYFICFKEQQSILIGEEENGAVAMGSVTRLAYTAPVDEGVTVKICIDQGAIVVYGSYTVLNPSSALHDFSEILTAAEGEVMPSSCLVSHITMEDVLRNSRDCSQCGDIAARRKRQLPDEETMMVTVYIAIEGASDAENQFSINSRIGSAFECAADGCGEHEVLIQRDVSCECECESGYERSGQNCSNINECTVVSDLCGNNGMCIDTNGNYTCGCEEGHIRDGQHCRRSEVFQAATYVTVIGVFCLAALMLVLFVMLVYRIIRHRQKNKIIA